MKYSAEHYRTQLIALLPRGIIWESEAGSVLYNVIDAIAQQFARVDSRLTQLIEETDPRTTSEMLTDWERAYGLPDACTDEVDTIAERLNVLYQKVTATGGQSRQYYIDVAAALGFEITIDEFRPFTVESNVDYALYSTQSRFYWRVNAPEETVRYFTVDSSAAEPLSDWGNEILECVINRLKPAHTTAIFSYGG